MNLKVKKIFVIDSLLSFLSIESLNLQLNNVWQIIKACYAVACLKTELDEWEFILCQNVMQQQNGFDCGVHAIANVYCLVNSLPLPKTLPSVEARNWIKRILAKRSDAPTVPRKDRESIFRAKSLVNACWDRNVIQLNISKQDL